MREWLARVLDGFRRDRLDRELAEELRFHREQRERAARHAGSDLEEARFVARRQLGSVVPAQEAARDRWSWPPPRAPIQTRRYGPISRCVRGLSAPTLSAARPDNRPRGPGANGSRGPASAR